MPQHVGMDSERHLGGQPKPRHHPAKGNRRHRSAALAHEDISSGSLVSLETAQGAKFYAGQWMDGPHPIINPMDVQAAVECSLSGASVIGSGILEAAIRLQLVSATVRQLSRGELAGRAFKTLDHDEASDFASEEGVQEFGIIAQ